MKFRAPLSFPPRGRSEFPDAETRGDWRGSSRKSAVLQFPCPGWDVGKAVNPDCRGAVSRQNAEGSKLGPEAKPDASPEKREEEMTNIKIEKKPVYDQIAVAGKTYNTVTGTVDRKLVGRVLITTDGGFSGQHQVVGGDGTGILTVKPVEGETELFVELAGGVKSLASFKFFGGFEAPNKENAGVTDLFTTEHDKVERLVACALRMSNAHPECDGQWRIIDARGTRYFLRETAEVNESGKIAE